jgi:hypothetical protein
MLTDDFDASSCSTLDDILVLVGIVAVVPRARTRWGLRS